MGNTEVVTEQLNAAQQQAVAINDGPVLVVAGAGTGKTKVIVERIKRLIHDGIPAEQILALTFTEKAAGEMRDRVGDISLRTAMDVTIATYNGFGNDLLQDYGNEWGLGTIRLLGETGQMVFLREHLDELELDYFAPISNPDGQLDNLRGYMSKLKQQLVTPAQYQAFAAGLPAGDKAEALDKQKHSELARFYERYLALCRQNQMIDYDDQIFLTIGLLEARPNVLKHIQERYRYILVDEFQDTNPMQSRFVELLAGGHQNLMVVGDDDQSIYGWRGATLANILDFTTKYPKTQEVTLIENYRSTQPILDAAYRLIQNNNPERLEVINKLDKRLHAQTTQGVEPISKQFFTLEAELTWVADDIATRLQNGQDPSSIAILARRTNIVVRAHETLELHDIPHAIAGLSNDLYAQPAIKQLIEALRTIADPLDDMALFHCLSGPLFDLEQAQLSVLAGTARREQQSLTDTIRNSEASEFQAALAQLELWRRSSADLSVGDLAYAIITDSGWKQQLYDVAQTDPEIFVQVQALSKFFTTLKEFERIAQVPSVQSYLINLPALRAGGSDFEDASLDISDTTVNVMSIHRSKGLEWDTVYIIDCVEGSFPLTNRGGGLKVPDDLKAVQSRADEHMAEERRLMYVAATRARRELILTYGNRHGTGAPRKPSRFLQELLTRQADEPEPEKSQTSLELFAPRSNATAVPLPDSLLTDGKLTLSVSQVACWLDCPQDFYYKYVLGMPLPSQPSARYGTAIHQFIQRIFDGRRAKAVPTLAELTESLKAELPTSGYLTARSRERVYTHALETAARLYERFTHEELPLAVEQSFGVAIPETPLRLIGRIDAIYTRGNGVEIRDFKTSTSVTTPEQAKSRATGSSQLTLYALAWRLQHDEMPSLLTLDFVETEQLGSIRKQPKSLDTMQGKLQTMVEQLQAGIYPPGNDHTYCQHP